MPNLNTPFFHALGWAMDLKMAWARDEEEALELVSSYPRSVILSFEPADVRAMCAATMPQFAQS